MTADNRTDDAKNDDPFADIEQYRLSQNFAAEIGVERVVTAIPVRKPHRQSFIRTHPLPEMQIDTYVIYLDDDKETYLVAPKMQSPLAAEIIAKKLITTITRDGGLSLWPIRLPDENGLLDEWNRSALQAAEMAQRKWIRICSNMQVGAYEVFQAGAELPDPEWPELSLSQLLRIAFEGRIIDSKDHPVVRRLRGLA